MVASPVSLRTSDLTLPLVQQGAKTSDVVGGQDPLFVQYNQSLSYDSRFWRQDIDGSIAFARANHNCGILTAHELSEIERGFQQVAQEWQAGTFQAQENDEDIHTANERRLGEIIGKDIGGKLHTGRSRNDQVATDMRLWLRGELHKLKGYLQEFLEATAARAEQEIDHLCPGTFSFSTRKPTTC